MRSALCGLLLLAAGLDGQPNRRDDAMRVLTSTLTMIRNAESFSANLSQHLADDILALANPDRAPSRSTVVSLTDELTAALIGRKFSEALLARHIRDAVQGSGATFVSAADFRAVLSRAGVDPMKTQTITRRLMSVGEEVRGPDDVPMTRFK